MPVMVPRRPRSAAIWPAGLAPRHEARVEADGFNHVAELSESNNVSTFAN